jgi:hypothetical protein
MANNYGVVDLTPDTGDRLPDAFTKINTNFGLVTVKPSVDVVGNLPSSGNTLGDARLVTGELIFYIWNSSAWVKAPSDVSSEVVAARGTSTSLGNRLNTSLTSTGALKNNIVSTAAIIPGAVDMSTINSNVAGAGIKQNGNGSLSTDVGRFLAIGRTSAGTATTLAITVTGVLTTDIVNVSYEYNTNNVYITGFRKSTNTITVYFSGAPAVTDYVNYSVFRAT